MSPPKVWKPQAPTVIDYALEGESFLEPQRDSEEELHARIIRLVAAREFDKAMDEAVGLFGFYKNRGQASLALRLARRMRRLDLCSHVPYELEIGLLVEVGRTRQAALVSQELACLQNLLGRPQEARACAIRFELLTRPRQSWTPRPPRFLEIAPPLPPSQSAHLPALVDDDRD
jgi:hypothetical protein